MNFQYLDEFIDTLYEKEGIPSSQIIVRRGGEEIYYRAAGYQDVATGEPIRRDARYFLYSCSKVITVTAALQLLERGKFLMEEPVEQYLPEFHGILVERRDGRNQPKLTAPQKTMRIKHLFTMTSGMDYTLLTPEVRALLAEKPDASTAEIIAALAKHPLNFDPGTHWMYSLAHDVLARLVEVLSGEKFSEYVQKNIFDPVGMSHSGYHLTEEIRPLMAAQYKFNASLGKAVDCGLSNWLVPNAVYESGGAGVISTVDDLMRFTDTLTHLGVTADGHRILAERTVNLMRSDCLTDATRPDFNWQAMTGYGYGFGVRTLLNPAGGKGGSLSTAGEFGWGGAAGSYVHIDPETGVSIVYTQHMLNNKEEFVHPRLRNLVYAALGY